MNKLVGSAAASSLFSIQYRAHTEGHALRSRPQFAPLRASRYRIWASALRTRVLTVDNRATQKEIRALAVEYERLAQYVEASVQVVNGGAAPGRCAPRIASRRRAKKAGGRPYTCSNTKSDTLRPSGNGRWCRARRSE